MSGEPQALRSEPLARTVEALPVEEVADAESPGVAPASVAPIAVASVGRPAIGGARLPEPVPASSAAQRLQTVTVRAVSEVSYQLSRVGTLGVSGLLLLATAVATFIAVNLPQRASVDMLRAAVSHPAAPVSAAGFAAAQVGKVLGDLPARSHAPEVMEKVLATATAAGVELPRGQYEFISAREGVAAHYRVSLPVKTSYPQLREFMDKTLLALPSVGVESLRIERKSVGDEQIQAELRLDLYVRDEG